MAPKSCDRSFIIRDNEWNLARIKNIIDTLMEITQSSNINELKHLKILKCIWEKMEDKLKMDHESLRDFWYHRLHMQLFCSKPIYLIDTKIKLIEYLYVKGVTVARDINWNNVLQSFDGYTNHFLYRIYRHLTDIARLRINSDKLEDQISYLYNTYRHNLKDAYPENNMLPRLIYTNDKLIHHDEDLQIIACQGM